MRADDVLHPLRRARRRIAVLRWVKWTLLFVVGLQAITAAVITALASQRKYRRPAGGFPHLTLPSVRVGENTLRVYSYGCDLYDAMLAAIDNARETIFLETFIWKGDAVGEEFK